MDPVPDPLLPRKSGSTGNRTRTSGSVARISAYTSRTVLKPIWAYKIHLLDTVSTSNIRVENSRTLPIESFVHDNGRTLVRAEYGYPKGSPNTNS
jgi:hypothetical protein